MKSPDFFRLLSELSRASQARIDAGHGDIDEATWEEEVILIVNATVNFGGQFDAFFLPDEFIEWARPAS